MGVLQYADGLRVGWFWFDHGTGFGSVVIWLPGCLVGLVWLIGLFPECEVVGVWLGDSCRLRDTELNKARCGWVVAESRLGAMWSGYSRVYTSYATVLSSLQVNKTTRSHDAGKQSL